MPVPATASSSVLRQREGLDDFVTQVLPILQARGYHQRELGGANPARASGPAVGQPPFDRCRAGAEGGVGNERTLRQHRAMPAGFKRRAYCPRSRHAPRPPAIRRDLHRHPELAFEEHRTSARVAELLQVGL